MFKYFQAFGTPLSSQIIASQAELTVSTPSPLRQVRRNPWVTALRELVYRHIGVRVRQRRVRAQRRDDAGLEAYLGSHVCLQPFTKLDATHRGLAHVCCSDWLPTPIGDLDSDLLRQWAGPVAQKIRASVTDGSYSYCSRAHCRLITDRLLPHRDAEEVRDTLAAFADPNEVPPPRFVGLMHDESCNLTCPSCRTGLKVADRAKQKKLDRQFEEAILPLLPLAQAIYFGGAGDAFGSSHYRRIIKHLDRQAFPDLKIDFHTNAQLFDRRAWAELQLAGRVGNVEISIDAAQADTYAIVRRGGSFDRLLKNLAFIRGLRASGEIQSLSFSMVVQAQNFREMPAFVRLGQEYGADAVWFQMIRDWGTFSADEFREAFIGDPAHPLHHELVEVLDAPELSLPIAKVGNIAGYARPNISGRSRAVAGARERKRLTTSGSDHSAT